MSNSPSDSSMADQASLILESHFATELHISEPGDESCQSQSSSTTQSEDSILQGDEVDRKVVPQHVVLSTQSPAALKTGTYQLIPKNLAVGSRPKNRHHTTVVTFPVGLEISSSGIRSRHSAQGPDVSWEDYDSDGDGFALRRNRRNKSYRAAVTSLDIEAMAAGQGSPSQLKPVREDRAQSPGPARSPGRKRTLGRRKRNQNKRGSFKDATPRLYQEIRERGLHSTNQDELLDDFVVVEAPVEDQGIVVKSYRPVQLTWSQLPQVKDTGILTNISPQERKRQEAIFEIITSEHSYLHSLGILVRHFKSNEALRKTMTATEHHHLFSNISVIHQVSRRFFEDLERRHYDNPVIRDISDIVQNHAAHHFEPYIVYCSNETFQQRTLQKLLTSNAAFKETLRQIEGSSECGGLPMISFLILPMQRVTRLPLLLDTICQKTPDKTAEYFAAVWALHAISKLVSSCNDGARRMERTEQMYTIQKQMEFGKIKPFPLVSSSRWLKKRGELAVFSEELSIWRAFSTRSYYLFLFNDVLIVTKKKSDESFVVMDYATPENVEVEVGEDAEGQLSPPSRNSHYLSFRLQMSKNSEGRAEQISLVAESRVDRARWIVALTEHKGVANSTPTAGQPQYEATKAYMPKEPDELGLQQAELVIVLLKEEAWCYGERMRDGEKGWFPASCATEITNPTAMENNVQRMKRLRKETNV
ncbi:rho guanine nucleotide exchange factor 16 [Cheilinus undulatus]|uniref:rho guanine nucleotide exchange factor 16 n=1 Tax=Cheilinus undulatus TaxID=241271 RepID=UPI001BD52A77|nr:rho guanine nucleotide exchange factor 16 [Cheilinus undulatus]XP_041655109.1 rho guanine nucleotide exchange factor 16 [Cheilinus undulatus]